jgi:hypothetical protein
VSRPDRGPEVGVDFSPPVGNRRTVPLAAVGLLALAALAIIAAVTQLLLR